MSEAASTTAVLAESPAAVEEPKPLGTDEKPAPQASAEPGEAEKGKDKGEGGVQRRINELTRDKYRLEAKLEVMQDQLREKAATKTAEKAADDSPKPRPRLSDFTNEVDPEDAFLRAEEQWIRQEARREARLENAEKSKAEAAQNQKRALVQEWAEADEAIRVANTDYEEKAEVATKAMDAAVNESTGETIALLAQEMGNNPEGPELLYYLGQNPDKIAELAAMSPQRAVRALYRLAGNHQGETTEKPPPVSKAPPPDKPIKKVSAVDDGELRDDLPPAQFAERLTAKLAKRAASR